MNNPFEEIFKRLENIEKMIAPVTGAQPEERQDKALIHNSPHTWDTNLELLKLDYQPMIVGFIRIHSNKNKLCSWQWA